MAAARSTSRGLRDCARWTLRNRKMCSGRTRCWRSGTGTTFAERHPPTLPFLPERIFIRSPFVRYA
eukprot:3104987-Prymnesium_polylepis.1